MTFNLCYNPGSGNANWSKAMLNNHSEKFPFIGQIIAWITATVSTLSLSDIGTLVGIFSSLVMLIVVTYNQNKRTRLLAESLQRRDTIIGNIPNESQINSD